MSENLQLKHHINQQAVGELAELIVSVYSEFDPAGFITAAEKGLEDLELKARIAHLIHALAEYLPESFNEAAVILENVATVWPVRQQRNWNSYLAWPLIDYVSVQGINDPHRAFQVLEKLTPLFTAEFAIRPFLLRHFRLTYEQMLAWAEHENEHVRRLASEGLRPRLPWAQQLALLRNDPTLLWPVLDKLKTDSSLYVRRSVANNLNDISKDHPELVMAICQGWLKSTSPELDWVIRHGLRTLVKSGYTGVYALLGFSQDAAVESASLTVDKTRLQLGDTLQLTLHLRAGKEVRLVVDYRIGFKRANGTIGFKVFKWKNITAYADTELMLSKKHSFKPQTTRRFYPGLHVIECMINGDVVARAETDLVLG